MILMMMTILEPLASVRQHSEHFAWIVLLNPDNTMRKVTIL